MFSVRIDGISDDDLSLMGFTLVDENDEFKKYVDYEGSTHIVPKDKPRVVVSDMNDAIILANRASVKQLAKI
jgi:hypothetical protein